MSFTLLETSWEAAPRRAPPRTTLFAVGDVHGHAAHLDAMLRALAGPVAVARARGDEVHLVLMGDYVDRGPSSLGVLDLLLRLDRRSDGGRLHLLRGNHDRLMLELLRAREPELPAALARWRRKGGESVLRELGIAACEVAARPAARIAATVAERLGPERRALLGQLRETWRCGDWLFVHGGVHPLLPLEAQDPATWSELREPFLSAAGGWRHDFAVVHGHTVRGPEVLPHRVAVDSGPGRTGVLSAVEIAEGRLRFRCVTDRPDIGAFLALPGPRQGRSFQALERPRALPA